MADTTTDKKRSDELQTTGRQNRGLSRREDTFSSIFRSPFDLFNANPFTLMRRLTEEIDRSFEQSMSRGQTGSAFWSPAVDVVESEGKLSVRADLPGLTQDDVQVEATDQGLVISGERKSEQQQETKYGYRTERSYGRFYRMIPLPEGANVDEAKAQFDNGVLEVTIPVPQQQKQTKQIPIGTSEKKQPSSATAAQQTARQAG